MRVTIVAIRTRTVEARELFREICFCRICGFLTTCVIVELPEPRGIIGICLICKNPLNVEPPLGHVPFFAKAFGLPAG